MKKGNSVNYSRLIIWLVCFSPRAFAHHETAIKGVNLSLSLAAIMLGFFLIIYLINKNKIIKTSLYETIKYSSQPILITDTRGDIDFVNDVALELIDQSLDKVANRSIFEFVDGLPNCLLNSILCQSLINSKICACSELSAEHHDFSLIHRVNDNIPVNIRVLRQSSGGLVYYLQELSVQKQLESQLAAQNKVATLGQFLSGVLHEIGNPMAAIEGISTELVWQIEHNEQSLSLEYMMRQLNTIQEQAQRISQVKDEFSLIGQDSDYGIKKLELLDIESLIKRLVQLVKFDKRCRNIQINLNVTKHLPAITSDAGKLMQILLNVLSNAIDALQGQSDAILDISAVGDSEYVQIRIKDNGPGISQDKLDKVLKPFYTTKKKGTGLGLVICKQLANSLNANFNITSKVKQNTQIELSLPIKNGAV